MDSPDTQPLQWFDLAAQDPHVRFSPNCWRVRLALLHKGLEAEALDWRFTEKDRIAASGQGKVPVLVDGDRMLPESWDIACHLERRHPDRPSLFGGPQAQALARFVNQWVSEVLHPALGPILVPGIAQIVDARDRAYFVQTREAALGATLEQLRARRPDAQAALLKALQPLRSTLGAQDFLSGNQPLYADIVAYAAFQWARMSDPDPVLPADDSLRPWLRRMDAHYPQAAAAPGVRYAF